MILTLPDIRQKNEYDCGAACVSVVLQFHRIPPVDWVWPMCDPILGITLEGLYAAFRGAMGHQATVMSGVLTLGVLRGLCNDEKPVVCLITVGCSGHWVVVKGVTKTRVYIHDPELGPQQYTLEQWLALWVHKAGNRLGIVAWPA